ncbi:MAG: hypothetical protein NTZ17_14720 [Phycisphaerae bacterium]|nr:hypothetical protein [Phycisphaerae bacterium]
MSRFPDFGKDLQRGFKLDERCFDCVELYAGCKARPENPALRCADYFPLPEVGVNGKTGQEIPPSRMGDRKEPRIRSSSGAPVRPQVQPEKPPARQLPQTNPHREYPAANYGLAGERLCPCGARLPKRKKCCETCREKRRAETLHGRRNREGALRRVQTVSDVPFSGPARRPARPTACAHR